VFLDSLLWNSLVNRFTQQGIPVKVFKYLRSIDRSCYNILEGGIPKSFWMNACKLKSLELSDNGFNDELQVIIHHLSRCARY
jgi:hypothetical protein